MESWRRLHENSHRPGSLSHLLAKKVYNYASGTTGAPSRSTDTFYEYDTVGNVAAISNGAGTRTYAFAQDAWGNELSVGAFTGDSWTAARNAGVWEHQTGKWIDGFTGLYYFHARFYDSKVGRFVGRDPVREVGGTIYTIASNVPTRNTDMIAEITQWRGLGLRRIFGLSMEHFSPISFWQWIALLFNRLPKWDPLPR